MKLDYKTLLWVLAFLSSYAKALEAQGLTDLATPVKDARGKLMVAVAKADPAAYKRVNEERAKEQQSY